MSAKYLSLVVFGRSYTWWTLPPSFIVEDFSCNRLDLPLFRFC